MSEDIIINTLNVRNPKKVKYSKLLDSTGVKSSFNIYDYIV